VSRSGYSDDIDQWDLIKWRGQVASAIRGRRGQEMLRDLLAALDSMPDKSLTVHELETPEGEVCALGALGKARALDMQKVDPDEPEDVAALFGVAHQLVQEIVYENDECGGYGETPEHRWKRMRNWVAGQIRDIPQTTTDGAIEPAGRNEKGESKGVTK